MSSRSLTFRLSMLVAMTSVLVAGLAGTWSYFRALQEARNLQDDVLVQVGSIAAVTTSRAAAEVDEIPLIDTASDIDVTSFRKAGLPASTPNGLGNADIAGTPRRIFVIRSATGAELVVSQSVEVRDEVARNTAFAALLPVLLLVPALVIAIHLVIRSVLRPVNRLADEVRDRDASDLSPLGLVDAPDELRAFLTALNSQLERVDAALTRERMFIAEAAHELRTPLTAMSLQLERAAIAPDSIRLRERLGELGRGVERSRHLIDQLLDLARAQAATSGTLPSQNLETIVRHVVGDLLPLADHAEVELEVDLSGAGRELLPVAGATSILRNLLDNAIRYSRSGGRVLLTAQLSEEHLTISVEDNGPGISSPENMLRPFARGGDQATQGSGLGLAIVAEQLRHLPGRLELRPSSHFSHGTEARVTILRAVRNPGLDTPELNLDA